MAHFAHVERCTINIDRPFKTRNGGIKKLEAYIRLAYGDLDQSTLQLLVEEYKWKESMQPYNCGHHIWPTICLSTRAAVVSTTPPMSSPAPAMVPAVPLPGAEIGMDTETFWRLVASYYGIAQRLRPEAPEFVPRQTNSSPENEATENGPSAHQRFGHDAVKPETSAVLTGVPETETIAASVEGELCVAAPNDPLRIPHFKDCHNWDLLVDSEPTTPSDGRYGAIGLGRPTPS